MDKVPDGTDVVLPLLRERQGLAHQAADPLPQRVVQPLDMAGLPAVFAHWTVAFRWEDAGIGVRKIAVAHRTLAIDRWLRFPHRK